MPVVREKRSPRSVDAPIFSLILPIESRSDVDTYHRNGGVNNEFQSCAEVVRRVATITRVAPNDQIVTVGFPTNSLKADKVA